MQILKPINKMENQTVKEANEIIDVFKSKLLFGCRHEKTISVMRKEIVTLLNDYNFRKRIAMKQVYANHIERPKPTFKNRLRFLFFGKL